MNKFMKNVRSEEGFTLIELLVVIVIIGILAAIAIPVFLSQRQKANDAAVQSDMVSVVTTVVSMLVATPNASSIINYNTSGETIDEGYQAGSIYIKVGNKEDHVFLSEGVFMDITGDASGYTVFAYHIDGSKYTVSAPMTKTR